VKLDARLMLFVFLAGLFITALLVGDIIGGKLYQLELGSTKLTISVGMIPFPIVFLLTDLINEFYGKRAAQYLTLVGFVMALLTIAILTIASQVPFAPFTQAADWTGFDQASFDRIFTGSRWMLFSSTVAYLVAQLIDIGVFHFVKRKLGDRMLWLRATGSTVVSQLVDTFVILLVAFGGQLSFETLISLMITSYSVKVVIAIALTPLIYAGHALVERGLGLEPNRVAQV